MGGKRRIPFAPTPHDIISKILSIANPNPDDKLYDLGSGDGRILIGAAQEYKCEAIGIESNPELYRLSLQKCKKNNVNAKIILGNFYEYSLRDADIVFLYLLPEALENLKPNLLTLKRGARIICHDFPIPGWKIDEVHKVYSYESGRKHTIYLYKVK